MQDEVMTKTQWQKEKRLEIATKFLQARIIKEGDEYQPRREPADVIRGALYLAQELLNQNEVYGVTKGGDVKDDHAIEGVSLTQE